jgi:hypothetical protein
MLMKLEGFFKTIVPENWSAETTDSNGQPVYFTAQQFLDSISPDDITLHCDYEVVWQAGHNYVNVSRYPGLLHAAATCEFSYKTFVGDPFMTERFYALNVKAYAEKSALMAEALSMDTETDIIVLSQYCRESVLPHYLRQVEKGYEPTICGQFVDAWVDAYAAASVRRMRRLATERREASKELSIVK